MKTVFFDVDTQIDFMFPAGALYVPGAEAILPVIARLNRRAPSLVSTMDAHAEDDPEFRRWPHHCVAGAWGQRKPACTLIEDRGRQFFLEKQTLDCFASPRLPGLLAELSGDAYLVYGVVTEICVKMAAFGLLKTGKPVSMITDAVRALDTGKAEVMFREFQAAGGQLISSEQALGQSY